MKLTERENILLTKALDGTLTGAERSEIERLTAESPELAEELRGLRKIKEATMELQFKQPHQETWDQYWAGVYSRLERGAAWILISIGAAILLAIGGYNAVVELIADASLPLHMKIAIGALLLGAAILVVSVAREKFFIRKTDKYRKVVR